jgi:hypothetical protein
MNLTGYKTILRLCGLCFLSLAVGSCARSGAESNQAPPPHADGSAAPEPTATPSEITDPTCCGPDGMRNIEGLARAWRQFTEGGRFRLARRDEMTFPESVKRERAGDWESVSRPFQYAWGKRGFDTDKEHLVAIVVDTTRDGPERFSMVIFSSPGGGNEYHPYWLYRNRNLSRTMISAPSGSLMLIEYNEDGTGEGCDVFWDQKSKRYYCKPMKG